MTEIVIEKYREEAKDVVKLAMERTSKIARIDDEGQRIVGRSLKSELLSESYLIVDIPDNRPGGPRTTIEARSPQGDVRQLLMLGQPERVESEFLDEVNEVREMKIEEIQRELAAIEESDGMSTAIKLLLTVGAIGTSGVAIGVVASGSSIWVFAIWAGISGLFWWYLYENVDLSRILM